RSLKSATSYWRRPGDVGLYFLTAISGLLEEVDGLAGRDLHDRLLPVLRLRVAAPHPADAAAHDHRVDVGHAHVEERLDGLTDLLLVRAAVDLEEALVLRLASVLALLGQA